MGRHIGQPWPLGSTVTSKGVNFCVAAPNANRIELLIFESGDSTVPDQIIEFDPITNRSGDYWHMEIEEIGIGCCYGYRVFGPIKSGGHGFQPAKVLLDPATRAITGWENYDRKMATGPSPNTRTCLKSIVSERHLFDFKSHPRPRNSWQNTVIYELHIGTFTNNSRKNRSEKMHGAYLDLIEKLPYLKQLGITAIEILPIFIFDPEDAPAGRNNVWGYSPLNWFTPHHEYCKSENPLEARNEIRTLVAACHDAKIEVILDVVYNHTTEGNQDGPTLSWRGLADEDYYQQDSNGSYLDVSGCGNSISANEPITTELIIESMKCWALELGIDGFRFDLGIALSRGKQLQPLEQPPLFTRIDAEPSLSDLKMVSEPWDCGGLYRLDDFPSKSIGTWNGHFRDAIRSFWKGDDSSTWKFSQRLKGSPDLYKRRSAKLGRSINFITAHDGFTLKDLVSF